MIKLNIGCGHHPLHGWVNIDSDPATRADRFVSVPPIPYDDGSVDEIFAGHYLEHLTQEEADNFLAECYRVLKVGGKLGIVVPDIAEVMIRYLRPATHAKIEYPQGVYNDMHDLDDVCRLIIFSTVQESHHHWAYDRRTLGRLLDRHKFMVTGEINQWMDSRISVGAWYQFGLDSTK